MDTLLVNPRQGGLANVPFGTLSLGTYLRKFENREVRLVNAGVVGEDAALHTVRRIAPKVPLVGLACMSSDTPFVKAAADAVKEVSPTTKVVVGGPHAVLCPEQTARYESIDFVAYGEAEESMAQILRECESAAPDWSRVPGIVFGDGGEIRRTQGALSVPFFDLDYDLLEQEVRDTFGSYLQVLTGRGCNSRCTFCYNSILDQRWRGRPMTDVMNEVERLVARYHPKIVYFRDENFFQGRKRVREFIDLYKEKGFSFEWRTSCRANYINERYISQEVLSEMADAGLTCLKFGFESGSPKILKQLRKGMRLKHLRNAVIHVAREPRIQLNVSFLMGVPGETKDDARQTMDLCGWILRQDPGVRIVGPQYYRVYPGGELYNVAIDEHGFEVPQDFEGWVERYLRPENLDGMVDGGIDYPWVSKAVRFLALNGEFMIFLAHQNPPPWFTPRKRRLLWPFRQMARLRFKIGWYGLPADLWMARVVMDSTIGKRFANSRFYEGLRKMGWYKIVRETRLFDALRWLFTGNRRLAAGASSATPKVEELQEE